MKPWYLSTQEGVYSKLHALSWLRIHRHLALLCTNGGRSPPMPHAEAWEEYTITCFNAWLLALFSTNTRVFDNMYGEGAAAL